MNAHLEMGDVRILHRCCGCGTCFQDPELLRRHIDEDTCPGAGFKGHVSRKEMVHVIMQLQERLTYADRLAHEHEWTGLQEFIDDCKKEGV